MHKIGIITFFFDNFNYGALLQAYALQNILSNYVCDAEVILIDPVDRKVSPINELCYKIRNIFLLNKFKARKKAMRNFQLNYVKHSKYYTESNILEANNECSCTVKKQATENNR